MADHHAPHAFQPGQPIREWNRRTRHHETQPNPNFCKVCGRTESHPLHVMTLPGCETVDTERETARGIAQAEELTAELRRPLADVSKSAGEMERHSPLFFGTGDNPQLF